VPIPNPLPSVKFSLPDNVRKKEQYFFPLAQFFSTSLLIINRKVGKFFFLKMGTNDAWLLQKKRN